MKRYLLEFIRKDLKEKIVLISGPRQTGKTTLSKMLDTSNNYEYYNYDYESDRKIIEKLEWDRKKKLVIFDELHKKKKWKSWIKGIYDAEGIPPHLLVTGSAKLDTFKKGGDSLAGRYFSFRLYPFDLKELKQLSPSTSPPLNLKKNFATLLEFGGFPEPFLKGTKSFYQRWRRNHQDIVIKQDLIYLENVTNIMGIENLISLLKSRVGSTISHNNLARDLDVDPKTVKNWLDILERLYVIFKVTPYSNKIKDSLLKAPKYYFYDNGQVEGDQGLKLENLVAMSLIKELHFLQDTEGSDVNLHFLRTKRGEEIDFLVLIDKKPKMMIEVKWSDDNFTKNFFFFDEFFIKTPIRKLQLVGELKKEKTLDKWTEMRSAMDWLSNLNLQR
jgi:predicted AAA+ superfamily ATPase